LPFDPGALTSSIKDQIKPTTPEPHSSPADPQKVGAMKAIATVPLQIPEPETRPAAKASTKPKTRSLAPVDSPPLSEENETPAKSERLWLLVTLTSLLFVASGILLTSYTLARGKGGTQPRRLRHPKGHSRSVVRSKKLRTTE